ncbi:RNA polymerase sigma factor [Plesiocystis pacifica]|uniref:RNA polymerase sigma factor n=1 Tax=Plesiocystis pacifica TaxID=191768 RepID=UPI0012FC2850|nr:sigma-70 family RNA polymerase sigma factor [Plesiocystis pacifica]
MTRKSDREFFERSCEDLRRYARRWIPESELGDFVQDCMTVLIEKRSQVENERAFLYAVARNKIKQFYEKRARGLKRFFPSFEGFEEMTMESLSTSLSIRVARHNDLEVGMQGLKSRQFAAFQLRYIEGLTEPDAAKVLSISMATLKRDLERARRQLRRALGDADDEQLDSILRNYVRGRG